MFKGVMQVIRERYFQGRDQYGFEEGIGLACLSSSQGVGVVGVEIARGEEQERGGYEGLDNEGRFGRCAGFGFIVEDIEVIGRFRVEK